MTVHGLITSSEKEILICPKFVFPKGRALFQGLPDLANKNTDAS